MSNDKKNEIKIAMGALIGETIEYQLRCQGYTLGEDAKAVQQANESLHYMCFAGMITATMRDKMQERIFKYILKNVKPTKKRKK